MDGLDRPKLCLTPQEHWCKKCTRFGPPEGKEADYFFNPCTGWSLALNSLWGLPKQSSSHWCKVFSREGCEPSEPHLQRLRWRV